MVQCFNLSEPWSEQSIHGDLDVVTSQRRASFTVQAVRKPRRKLTFHRLLPAKLHKTVHISLICRPLVG